MDDANLRSKACEVLGWVGNACPFPSLLQVGSHDATDVVSYAEARFFFSRRSNVDWPRQSASITARHSYARLYYCCDLPNAACEARIGLLEANVDGARAVGAEAFE